MRRVVNAAMVVLAALLAYLLLWPVPIKPVAWQSQKFRGYAGPHAQNVGLAKLRLVPIAPHVGPEHIVVAGRDRGLLIFHYHNWSVSTGKESL